MITSATELVTFLQRYHRPLLEKEPPRTLACPDMCIPEPLRLLYDAFGHHICGMSGSLTAQDELYEPQKLRVDGHEVVFLNENQGCWSCTYEVDTPGHPVLRYGDEPVGVRQADTLEEFLITFALQEAVMSSPWSLFVDGASSAAALGLELSDLHRRGRYAYDGPTHDFWLAREGEVLCMEATVAGVWLASYSEKVLDLRRPEFQYSLIPPGDPEASQKSPSLLNRLSQWLRG